MDAPGAQSRHLPVASQWGSQSRLTVHQLKEAARQKKQLVGSLQQLRPGLQARLAARRAVCRGSGFQGRQPRVGQDQLRVAAPCSISGATWVSAVQRPGGHPGGCSGRRLKMASLQMKRCTPILRCLSEISLLLRKLAQSDFIDQSLFVGSHIFLIKLRGKQDL